MTSYLEDYDSLGDLSPSHHSAKSLSNALTDSLVITTMTDSVRSSSTSSLARSDLSSEPNTSEPNARGTPISSALKTQFRATSAQVKKVSICDAPSPVMRRDHAVSPNGGAPSSHRASLIQVSSGRKAKKVRFFVNGDKFFKGAVIAVNNEKFRTFDKMLEHLTRIMCTQVSSLVGFLLSLIIFLIFVHDLSISHSLFFRFYLLFFLIFFNDYFPLIIYR